MGIVEQLRSDAEDHIEVANSCDCNPQDTVNWRHAENAREAATEIEQLRAKVAELGSRTSPASVLEGYALVPVEILDRFPEINPSNYDHDGACALNAWGVELVLSAAPTTPVSEDRKDAPQEDYFADACRLALELECLLLDCKDTAVTAKWWDSAHEALEQHRERIAAMQEDKP